MPMLETNVGIQVTVMGIPMRLYDNYFTPSIVAELASYGVSAKRQPNSVAINKRGIDKALCVSWLRDHFSGGGGDGSVDGDFSLGRALAFGDIPTSVDKPLAQFPPMQFVSLSTTPATDPTDTKGRIVHVGREEDGTAAFLEAMLVDVLPKEGGAEGDGAAAVPPRLVDDHNAGDSFTLFSEANVDRWVAAARAALAKPAL